MKALEKSFKVETKTIEEFFKNRAYFTTKSNRIVGLFFSRDIYTPEEYNLDFLKEKNQTTLLLFV